MRSWVLGLVAVTVLALGCGTNVELVGSGDAESSAGDGGASSADGSSGDDGDDRDDDGRDGDDDRDDGELVIGPAENACIDERLGFGFDDFTELFTDTSPQARERWEQVMRALIECVPDLDRVPTFVEQFTAGLTQGFPRDPGIDTTEGACLLRYVLDNAADPAVALGGSPSDDDTEVFLDGVEACFDADSQAIVFGDVAGSDAESYGDDPELDAVYDACADGNDRACDLLFELSFVDTEYGQMAMSCGGRRAPQESYCTAGIVPDASGWIGADSPVLAELIADCEDGDMLTCDLLYWSSPFDSDHEHVGFTCGGRAVFGAAPSCRAEFG